MGGDALVRKEPVGALLGIMPWNFPYYQVARFAAPNLMIGNTILLKHAPQCPESALAMEAIFADAGLPDGGYVNVFATNDQVADMIADPRVVGVSVTGSERAGAAVAEVAGPQPEEGRPRARRLRRVHRCSTPPTDLDAAVQAAVVGRMGNAGQACNGSKRMIVVDDLYDDVRREVHRRDVRRWSPGDPTDSASGFGPLSSEGAAQTLIEQIDDAVEKGATVLDRRQARRPSRAPSWRPPCWPTSRRTCAPTARSSSAPPR